MASGPSTVLVFIHGFLGSEDSFAQFPRDLLSKLQTSQPDSNCNVAIKMVPRYNTKDTTDLRVSQLLSWLVENANSSKCHTVILLAHSMGGVLAVDVFRKSKTQNIPVNIRGIICFDTPFYGIAPSVFNNVPSAKFKKFISNLDVRNLSSWDFVKVGVIGSVIAVATYFGGSSVGMILTATATSPWVQAKFAKEVIGGIEESARYMEFLYPLVGSFNEMFERIEGMGDVIFMGYYLLLVGDKNNGFRRTFVVEPPKAHLDIFDSLKIMMDDEIHGHMFMFDPKLCVPAKKFDKMPLDAYKERIVLFEAFTSIHRNNFDHISESAGDSTVTGFDLPKNFEQFRLLCFKTGIPDSPGLRARCWKVARDILLGYLPFGRPEEWDEVLFKQRSAYYNFVNDFIPVMTDFELEEIRKISTDHHLENIPLLSECAMLEQIDRDVRRTLPDIGFFQQPIPVSSSCPLSSGYSSLLSKYSAVHNKRGLFDRIAHLYIDDEFGARTHDVQKNGEEQLDLHWESLERILFIWCKLNNGISYVQGMNEILAPLFYVFANDIDEDARAHAEADS
ncbi:hypothetical protein HK096_002483, partial [Nowakowskiella sp. JEL0078]